MRLLKLVLALEIVLGAAWTLPLIAEERIGMGGLLLFFWIQPFQLLLMLASIAVGLKEPDARRFAVVTFAAPLALLCLPGLLRLLFGAPVLEERWQFALVLGAPVGAVVVYCLCLPRRAAARIPQLLLESRALNIALLLLSGLGVTGWVALWACYFRVLVHSDDGMLIVFGALCTVLIGLLSFPIALFGYLGLFQSASAGVRLRGLHLAQLVTSSFVMLATALLLGLARLAATPVG